MAFNPSTLVGHVVKFHTNAVDPGALLVIAMQGRDAISSPYAFEIDLVAERKRIDAAAMLSSPAMLAIKQGVKGRDGKPGVQTRRYHGILAWFDQSDGGGQWTAYRCLLVPRLWRLSLSIRSRIFMKRTVPKIVESILKEHGFQGGDFEFRLSRPYAEKEYVVQYQESDLDFIQRLLEKEGVSYFFKEGDESEKVIFGDSPAAHAPVLGEHVVPYQPSRAAMVPGGPEAWFGDETVRAFTLRRRLVQQKVHVQDYNYRTPGLDLTRECAASPSGYGDLQIYGEHYKTTDEGDLVARLRAEELKSGEQVYSGAGAVRSFRAGCTFSLSRHYSNHPDFEREYLITEVRHKIEQMLPAGKSGKFAAAYENQFSAIPAEIPFRPARRTPIPRANNINAKIDAAGDGQYAEIDDDGRYKVQMPFDPGKGGGSASRWMRMMQPYAGGGMGMHFPLHKGTEVLITHVNSDWDRPMIAGAVPNPETGSPVKGGNATECKIATGGGNQIGIEDSKGAEKVSISTPYDNTWIQFGSL